MKSGIPIKWIIYEDEVTVCTNRIVITSLNISRDISSYQRTIVFTPKIKE
ncbi:MAG: hypothetical protein ACUVQN_01430 [Caldisericia bacterium]